MKIAHLNIRSIFTGFNEFVSMVLENEFDVISITETWLSDEVDPVVIQIPGYTFFNKNRERRGGGIGVYIKNPIKFKNIVLDIVVSDTLEYLCFNMNVEKKSLQ